MTSQFTRLQCITEASSIFTCLMFWGIDHGKIAEQIMHSLGSRLESVLVWYTCFVIGLLVLGAIYPRDVKLINCALVCTVSYWGMVLKVCEALDSTFIMGILLVLLGRSLTGLIFNIKTRSMTSCDGTHCEAVRILRKAVGTPPPC